MLCPLRVYLLAAVGTLGAASLGAVPLHAQGPIVGSQVPCAVPMSWTIDRIDSGFDLDTEQALAAAREAGALWEAAVGGELFDFDGDGAHPIVFDFDQRQAAVAEGQERERALESERRAIEARRAAMDEASREYQRTVRDYEQDIQQHSWAVRDYNNDLMRFDRQDASPPERTEMERRRQELERNGRTLDNRARELNRRAETMQDEAEAFNAWIEAFNRRQDAHARAYPQAPTEAGQYAETVFWMDGEADSVERRIRVFQFSGYADLVRILAHEMGHALGLGHAPGQGAVMSAVGSEFDDGITEVDVRMLRARCPGLGG